LFGFYAGYLGAGLMTIAAVATAWSGWFVAPVMVVEFATFVLFTTKRRGQLYFFEAPAKSGEVLSGVAHLLFYL
jgi:hypothetical protein